VRDRKELSREKRDHSTSRACCSVSRQEEEKNRFQSADPGDRARRKERGRRKRKKQSSTPSHRPAMKIEGGKRRKKNDPGQAIAFEQATNAVSAEIGDGGGKKRADLSLVVRPQRGKK